MKVFLVTGQSGAGLTVALGALEDTGFETVGGLPAGMLPALVEQYRQRQTERLAVRVTVRTPEEAALLLREVEQFRKDGEDCRLIYLEADEQTLVNRYKFTRRPHPAADQGVSLVEAIRAERDCRIALRAEADSKLDTTRLSARQLRETMFRIATESRENILAVSVLSFGFKYGIPADADLVFDVRFLPNPYYLPELREKNGTDTAVRDYVFRDGTADEYMDKLCDLADFLIPQYQREGKAMLTIAVGCTGGRHRSVAIAQALFEHLQSRGILSAAIHRDWQKG